MQYLKRCLVLSPLLYPLCLFACSSGGDDGGAGAKVTFPEPDGSTANDDSGTVATGDGGAPSVGDSSVVATGDGSATGDAGAPFASCPNGSTAGTANGLPVCRAASGIPLFTNVYVILMENTSLSTLSAQLGDGGVAPNLGAFATEYATGTDYHGVAHPSLPNYIALVSGNTQGVACDCQALPDAGACGALCSTFLVGSCSCVATATNLGAQLATAQKTWMAFGEDMGVQTPCNLASSGNYAVRHVPFLYFDDVQSNPTLCQQHVVDLSLFDPGSPAAFTFIAPNLVDDMHDPFPASSTNIANGDKWIGPQVNTILASAGYKAGGLLVVVWDEDDLSGAGPLNTDNPVPIFVFSPFAKSGGFKSTVKADHYALLATIEDGLGLPRLGNAGSATPLVDYFPAQ
jgi:acid phosphatase